MAMIYIYIPHKKIVLGWTYTILVIVLFIQ